MHCRWDAKQNALCSPYAVSFVNHPIHPNIYRLFIILKATEESFAVGGVANGNSVLVTSRDEENSY